MTDVERSTTGEQDGPVSVFRLDPELVDAVVRGEADRRADEALAGSLGSLGQQIESLLGDGRDGDALALSLATVEMLRDLAPRVGELEPELRGLHDHLEQLRCELEEARDPG
jgi:hypothetical protein